MVYFHKNYQKCSFLIDSFINYFIIDLPAFAIVRFCFISFFFRDVALIVENIY
jgi:hypothetical protein